MLNDLRGVCCLHICQNMQNQFKKIRDINLAQKAYQILIFFILNFFTLAFFYYYKMDYLEIEISKPSYINRNQTIVRYAQSPKIKAQKQIIPVKKISSTKISPRTMDSKNIQQIKLSLLKMLGEAKQNWQKQLQKKQTLIINSKRRHRYNLQAILLYIEQLRKKAYNQYKHRCNNSINFPCAKCNSRNAYFYQLAKQYLQDGLQEKQSQKNRAIQELDDCQCKSNRQKDLIDHISQQNTILSKNGKRIGINKHKKQLNQLQSNLNQVSKGTICKISKLSICERKSNKSEQSIDAKELNRLQRLQKELQKYNIQRKTIRKVSVVKLIHQNSSVASLTGSVKRLSSYSNSNSKKVIDQNTDEPGPRRKKQKQAVRRSIFKPSQTQNIQIKVQNTKSRFKPIQGEQNNTGQDADKKYNQPFEIRLFHKQSINKSAKKNKIINKIMINETESIVQLDITEKSQEQIKEVVIPVKQKDQIKALLKQKQYLNSQTNQKFSRYRREKLFYEILKEEIMKEDVQPNEEEQNLNQSLEQQLNSNLLQKKSTRRKDKQYSILERKQSLITKLNALNQHKSIDNLKEKVQQVLHQKGYVEQSDKNGQNNIVEKFLSEVLKISDLKKLMRQKFAKESNWSPKMRQMHQFYTYLQFSLEKFNSKLKKIEEQCNRQMSFDSKQAQFDVNNLILDQNIGNYEGVQQIVFNQQEHHRQIQCSMKYYGIDVKRIKNVNVYTQDLGIRILSQFSQQVGQKSMKKIEETPPSILFDTLQN